jgi:Protein of unknown function (DUF3307)
MVHSTYKLFLALYFAHLVTDFVLQSDSIVAGKNQGSWRSYLWHGFLYCATTLAVVTIMNPDLVRTRQFEIVVIALCVVHLVLDRTKASLVTAKWVDDGVKSFTADQSLHLLTVIGATLLINRPSWQAVLPYLQKMREAQGKILFVAVIYILVVFGSGYFIRYLIRPLWTTSSEEPSEHHDEVVNAGLYIGWLERFLALTAIFLQSPGTVGLILTAKSIARYPELKSPGQFVEYFLIGTLLSISIAILGGIILLKIFYGTVVLAK